MTKDMTSGSPMKHVLSFTIPLIFGNLFQQFYSMVDTIIVGRLLGTGPLAAVGSTGALINLIVNVFIGLSVGTNVLVARYYGAGQQKDLEETVHTSIATSLVSGVILLVYLLSFWWIFALLVLMFGIIFLPAIIFGAVMLGYVTLLMALPLLLYLVALLIPYVMGIVYDSRYLIACAPCLGWKKPWRIFLQVVMCLPWLRWIVTAITMEKMRKIH